MSWEAENSKGSYDVAIAALREQWEIEHWRKTVIGDCTLYNADCLDVMARLKVEGALVDSVVCDPPYHLTSIVKRFGATSQADDNKTAQRARDRADGMARLSRGFMGKVWDGGDVAFRSETWRLVYDVMKPGAHLVAFGGTRTYHRMACAIEDAGFEIRDQLAWCYGSGFPKSHDVSKGIDRAAGAEREDKFEGSFERRAGPTGNKRCDVCGKWLVSGNPCQCPRPQDAPVTESARQWEGWGTALKPAWEPIVLARKPLDGTVAANVLQHGTGALNIDGCRIGGEGGTRGAGPGPQGAIYGAGLNGEFGERIDGLGRWPANLIHDGSPEVLAGFPVSDGAQGVVRGSEPSETGQNGIYGRFARVASDLPRADSGSAARFFYCAKADDGDRLGSKHPTVKPVDLMAWLVRLVCPKGGLVLDPFAGTGTTGMACLREGMRAILIEREAEYFADIKRRLAHVSGADTPLFGGPS